MKRRPEVECSSSSWNSGDNNYGEQERRRVYAALAEGVYRRGEDACVGESWTEYDASNGMNSTPSPRLGKAGAHKSRPPTGMAHAELSVFSLDEPLPHTLSVGPV